MAMLRSFVGRHYTLGRAAVCQLSMKKEDEDRLAAPTGWEMVWPQHSATLEHL